MRGRWELPPPATERRVGPSRIRGRCHAASRRAGPGAAGAGRGKRNGTALPRPARRMGDGPAQAPGFGGRARRPLLNPAAPPCYAARMDPDSELAKVKARIRALATRTVERGCSEAEAMAAAAKVGELLEVYGLTMSEVELREESCVQRILTFDDPRRVAMSWLFPALLRFTECRGWTVGRADYVIFGLEPDVQMAEYLMQVVAGALAYEEARFRLSADYIRARAAPQAVLRSFRVGFADRVAARLEELGTHRRATEAAARAAAPATGTALVLLKERKIEAAFEGLGVRLRTVTRSTVVRDRGAYGRGREAGGRVGLDRPVGAGPGAPRLPKR